MPPSFALSSATLHIFITGKMQHPPLGVALWPYYLHKIYTKFAKPLIGRSLRARAHRTASQKHSCWAEEILKTFFFQEAQDGYHEATPTSRRNQASNVRNGSRVLFFCLLIFFCLIYSDFNINHVFRYSKNFVRNNFQVIILNETSFKIEILQQLSLAESNKNNLCN